MLNYLQYLVDQMNLPTKIVVIVVIIYAIMNIVGEFLAFKGKVVPEVVRIRKYFKRKRQERETLAEVGETLLAVKASLDEMNVHYSADNIAMRDGWMQWVNRQAEVYDSSIEELKKGMDKNNEITLSLLIESKRNAIISFASYVINDDNPVTREQFNRIFKIYEEYEDIIRENGLTNGEVDVAIRIIRESYEHHMRNHTFIEQVRGYDFHVAE